MCMTNEVIAQECEGSAPTPEPSEGSMGASETLQVGDRVLWFDDRTNRESTVVQIIYAIGGWTSCCDVEDLRDFIQEVWVSDHAHDPEGKVGLVTLSGSEIWEANFGEQDA